jgi:hypothetical protein
VHRHWKPARRQRQARVPNDKAGRCLPAVRACFAFASNGTARGTEFQVSTHTSEAQNNSTICCGPGGDFVVAWEEDYFSRADDIFARRFADNGHPLGGAFQVNSYKHSPAAGTPTEPVTSVHLAPCPEDCVRSFPRKA